MSTSKKTQSGPARSRLESILSRAWQRRGVLACALWPLSMLFFMLSGLRRAGYRLGLFESTRLPLPVIVVGNVFIGGTGKTPFTIWLVDVLRRAGYRPGVVSRGYRGGKEIAMILPDSDPREAGDEPVLIARRAGVPVCIGRDRVAVAKQLMHAHPEVDVIVSDDGLQHYALARDIEIVLFDTRGSGNGWLLPAGPLREAASRRRDFTVVNAQHAADVRFADAYQMCLAGDHAEQLSDSSCRMQLSEVGRSREKVILAAAGIGNPQRFFSMLREAGLAFDEMPLPDHYDFSANPFAAARAGIILVTEKDAVKCRRIDALKSDPRIWVVPVVAQIDGTLADRIVEKLRGHPTA